MDPVALEPFFLPTPDGAIYLLHLPAQTTPRGSILWLPPFAEEANCARRHIVAAARECQRSGYASVLIDLYGTGESDGDLRDADWAIWKRNVLHTVAWLREKSSLPLWLAGVRAGCCLAAALAADVRPTGMLFWQPIAGRAALDNFLRMKLAAEWAGGEGTGRAADILGQLRAKIAAGKDIELGGYVLPARLAQALGDSAVSWLPETCARVAAVEFRGHQVELPPTLTPGFVKQLEGWRADGIHVVSDAMRAPAFWQLHETTLQAGLGAHSIALMESLP